MARPGRKPLLNAIRDSAGISRESGRREKADYEATLARRGLDLIGHGIDPSNAHLGLSGFTLGRLLLRWRADRKEPSAISQRQYNAGSRWAKIVRRHASVMGYRLSIRTPSFVMVAGGEDCREPPTEQQIKEIREEFSACYDAIVGECRAHGYAVRDITYGVCVENMPCGGLASTDYGHLRTGLNAIGDALAKLDKQRGSDECRNRS